jgi:hypothetical protein
VIKALNVACVLIVLSALGCVAQGDLNPISGTLFSLMAVLATREINVRGSKNRQYLFLLLPLALSSCGYKQIYNDGGFWQFGHMHPYPNVTIRYINDSLDVYYEDGYTWGHIKNRDTIVVYQCEGSVEAAVRYLKDGEIKKEDPLKIILIFEPEKRKISET